VDDSSLGRKFKGGEIIIREGEYGDCMYVIQTGTVEVVTHRLEGKEVLITELGAGEKGARGTCVETDARRESDPSPAWYEGFPSGINSHPQSRILI